MNADDLPADMSIPPASPPEGPQGARVRPGPHITEPFAVSPHWEALGHKIDETLALTRDLFRIAERPYQDPSWLRLKPNLLLIERVCLHSLEHHPDDVVAEAMLEEVQGWLLHRRK